ncbi:MAG: HEAT repeat domain-containing protein [Bacteroidetes bacterium]|nr:HEAT repeat domain-containing protein [Bacteroidota bacterium]
MTTSKHVMELLPDFLMGSFNEHEREEIQSHLKSCPECRQEFESLSMVWNSLGTLPDQKPSHAMRERFYSMLSAYEQGVRHAETKSSFITAMNGWVERIWPKQPAIQFVTAMLLFLVGGLIGTRIDQSTETTVERTTDNELAELRGEVQAMTRMLTVSLLQQQSASERLRGVSMSYRLEGGDIELSGALLNTLKYDPSPNVRLAALEALAGLLDQDRVRKELIQSLPKQTSPMLQIAMADLMVQMQDPGSKPALQLLLRNPNIDKTVRKRIEDSIKQIL